MTEEKITAEGAIMQPYYPCKFPFTYQGQEYNKCFIAENDANFCAIDAFGDDGKQCPGCWKNETYKVGRCYGDRAGICYTDTPVPGGKYNCNFMHLC